MVYKVFGFAPVFLSMGICHVSAVYGMELLGDPNNSFKILL